MDTTPGINIGAYRRQHTGAHDDSLTRRMVRFYEANPGEWLTIADMTTKFSCTQVQATRVIATLRSEGRLDLEAVVVYRVREES